MTTYPASVRASIGDGDEFVCRVSPNGELLLTAEQRAGLPEGIQSDLFYLASKPIPELEPEPDLFEMSWWRR